MSISITDVNRSLTYGLYSVHIFGRPHWGHTISPAYACTASKNATQAWQILRQHVTSLAIGLSCQPTKAKSVDISPQADLKRFEYRTAEYFNLFSDLYSGGLKTLVNNHNRNLAKESYQR